MSLKTDLVTNQRTPQLHLQLKKKFEVQELWFCPAWQTQAVVRDLTVVLSQCLGGTLAQACNFEMVLT